MLANRSRKAVLGDPPEVRPPDLEIVYQARWIA